MNRTSTRAPVFLKAEWRRLLMANYVVAPELLADYLPAGTTLDYWQGKCYISLVGFMFLNTAVMGWSIPWHRNFEEINLRFYVRRKSGEEWRRGVVFIKEIVPKFAISWVANTIYQENYTTRRMKHIWREINGNHITSYAWKPYLDNNWNQILVEHTPVATAIPVGSAEEFITEHYWGYAKKNNSKTVEYEVRHPRWNVYPVTNFELSGHLDREYGDKFASILRQPPASVFLADGSEIEVLKGNFICVG